jgi:hypothetical protein
VKPSHDQASKPRSPQQERRKSSREARHLPGWLSNKAGAPPSEQQRITVVNLSTGGVGFCASRPCAPKAEHWMIISSGAMNLSTRVRIVTCRPNDHGGFDVGAEFF